MTLHFIDGSHLYEGLLTVLMRLVFILYAEDTRSASFLT